jgi:hypothetical protein
MQAGRYSKMTKKDTNKSPTILVGGPDGDEPLRILYISRCDECPDFNDHVILTPRTPAVYWCNNVGIMIGSQDTIKKNCLNVSLLYIPKWCPLNYATEVNQ